MTTNIRIFGLGLFILAGLFAARSVDAQTDAERARMQYEQQQRDYWRAQEQQRQEQQRQQQIMNENARRQQEESRRFMEATTPKGTTQQAPAGSAQPQLAPGQAGAQADVLEEARRNWLKRSPLPADRNPLLGKWTRPASTRARSSDPFAQLGAMMQGGLCEMMFGGGVFEFRADRLVGSDQRSGAQELDRVEYRGDARRVVVIPKTTFKLIVFDFDGPNRINWAGQDCVLVRVGAPANTAAALAPASAANVAAPASAPAPAALSLEAGITAASGQFSPPRNLKVFVLKDSAETALARGGIAARPGMSSIKTWAAACQANSPVCVQGSKAMDALRAGAITTDGAGKAQVRAVPPGIYYLVAFSQADNHQLMWNVRVELKPGANAVTLDQRNATPLN